jgi:hypothetical protein
MEHRTAFARLRIGSAPTRPLEASLDLRIRCWLARVGWVIERRDTPKDIGTPAWPRRTGLSVSARACFSDGREPDRPAPVAAPGNDREPPPGSEHDGVRD